MYLHAIESWYPLGSPVLPKAYQCNSTYPIGGLHKNLSTLDPTKHDE
jgi:hypothetical protein